MRVEIVVSLIGALASVGAAYITATKAAETAAERKLEQLAVATAGVVDKNGNVIRHAGRPFTVSPQPPGRYRVNFRDPFPTLPIVVAISDGGDRGATAEINEACA